MQNTSFLYFDILTLTFKQKIIFFSAYIHIFEWVSIAHFYIYPHIYSTVCHMALFPLLLYVCFSLVKVCVSSFKPAKSHVWIFWGHFFLHLFNFQQHTLTGSVGWDHVVITSPIWKYILKHMACIYSGCSAVQQTHSCVQVWLKAEFKSFANKLIPIFNWKRTKTI